MEYKNCHRNFLAPNSAGYIPSMSSQEHVDSYINKCDQHDNDTKMMCFEISDQAYRIKSLIDRIEKRNKWKFLAKMIIYKKKLKSFQRFKRFSKLFHEIIILSMKRTFNKWRECLNAKKRKNDNKILKKKWKDFSYQLIHDQRRSNIYTMHSNFGIEQKYFKKWSLLIFEKNDHIQLIRNSNKKAKTANQWKKFALYLIKQDIKTYRIYYIWIKLILHIRNNEIFAVYDRIKKFRKWNQFSSYLVQNNNRHVFVNYRTALNNSNDFVILKSSFKRWKVKLYRNKIVNKIMRSLFHSASHLPIEQPELVKIKEKAFMRWKVKYTNMKLITKESQLVLNDLKFYDQNQLTSIDYTISNINDLINLIPINIKIPTINYGMIHKISPVFNMNILTPDDIL